MTEQTIKIEEGDLAGEIEISYYDGSFPDIVIEVRCSAGNIKVSRMELLGGELQIVVNRNYDR